jgi:hypothetical protein
LFQHLYAVSHSASLKQKQCKNVALLRHHFNQKHSQNNTTTTLQKRVDQKMPDLRAKPRDKLVQKGHM